MLSDSYLLCAAGTTDTFGGRRCGWPLKNLVLVLLAILAVNKVNVSFAGTHIEP